MIRLAILNETVRQLTWLFKENSPNEQGAFCLLREGRGLVDSRLIATKVLLPSPDAWERQGTGILRPRAQWISSAISCAVREHAGLLFVHSHPDPFHPIGMSDIDMSSFQVLAQHLAPILDGPFAAAVVHPYGWAGVAWSVNKIARIDSIVGVGRTLRFLSLLEKPSDTEIDDRQQSALGVVHERVRNLTVALVGCGGVGSPTGEQLIRMGAKRLALVDGGFLDTSSNVRRVFGSKSSDLTKAVPRRKVDVVGDHLDSLGLGPPVLRIHGDVRTERVFRSLLDTDLVINSTDNHGSRAVINDLASAYLLPVIDVGVRAGAKQDKALASLVAEVRILTPSTPCLWCRGTINAQVIRQENLPEPERAKLAKEGYLIGSTGLVEPSVVSLTVFGSGMATCALLAALSEEGEVAPSGYWMDGFLGDAHETEPKRPVDGCRCRVQLGLGDTAPPPFLMSAHEAERVARRYGSSS